VAYGIDLLDALKLWVTTCLELAVDAVHEDVMVIVEHNHHLDIGVADKT